MENENQISYDIRGAAFKVYNELGPGLLESVYETALNFELKEMGHIVHNQVGVPMTYRDLVFICANLRPFLRTSARNTLWN